MHHASLQTIMRRQERGLTLISLLIFGIIFVGLIYVGAQVAPYFTESVSVRQAVRASVDGATTPAQVIQAFDRQAIIDNIRTIRGVDLDIQRVNNQLVASYDYEARIPLFEPVSLVIRFHGSSIQ